MAVPCLWTGGIVMLSKGSAGPRPLFSEGEGEREGFRMWSRPRIWEDEADNRWITDELENVVVIVENTKEWDPSLLRFEVSGRELTVSTGGARSTRIATVPIEQNSAYTISGNKVVRRTLVPSVAKSLNAHVQSSINQGKQPSPVFGILESINAMPSASDETESNAEKTK